MSKRQNLLAVWQQIPVANRTVGAAASVTGAVGSLTTNNDKTGYSLTAGSYAMHASSNQQIAIAMVNVDANTGAISSVTTTRALVANQGCYSQEGSGSFANAATQAFLSSATVVAGQNYSNSTRTNNLRASVEEIF